MMFGFIVSILISAFFFVDRFIVIGLWQKDYLIFWCCGVLFGIFFALSGAVYIQRTFEITIGWRRK